MMATGAKNNKKGGDKTPAKQEAKEFVNITGKCKWFDVRKGWGFVVPEDGGQDVFVHQSVIYMDGFRCLAENEEVEFQFKFSQQGREAIKVTGLGGVKCKGRKRQSSTRCYNCGDVGHMALVCPEPSHQLLCYNCKAEGHISKTCPKPRRTKSTSDSSGHEDDVSKSPTGSNNGDNKPPGGDDKPPENTQEEV